MRRSGFTLEDIAEHTGSSVDAVRKALEGIDSTGMSKDLYLKIAAKVMRLMYEERKSDAVTLVAEEYGATVDHIRHICRGHGVELNGVVIKAENIRRRNEEMKRLRREGLSLEEVAARFDLHKRTVINLIGSIKNEEEEKMKTQKNAEQDAKIVSMRQEGATLVVIASELKVGFQRIYKALDAAGLVDRESKKRIYKPRMSAARTAERDRQLLAAAAAGSDPNQLADQFNISRQRVNGILAAARTEANA